MIVFDFSIRKLNWYNINFYIVVLEFSGLDCTGAQRPSGVRTVSASQNTFLLVLMCDCFCFCKARGNIVRKQEPSDCLTNPGGHSGVFLAALDFPDFDFTGAQYPFGVRTVPASQNASVLLIMCYWFCLFKSGGNPIRKQEPSICFTIPG